MGKRHARSAGLLLLVLAACGGGGSAAPPATGSAAIRTFAYVDTDCREDARSGSAQQSLQILNGDRAPLTVAEMPMVRLPPLKLCRLFGQNRNGDGSVFAGFFQRLGVSPDASTVVFEVTFDFTVLAGLGIHNPLTPDEQGIFLVHADGSGLRRLGSPSHAPSNKLIGFPGQPGSMGFLNAIMPFSPDSTTVAFEDRGPGPMGEDAIQIFTMDLATGTRHQVTHLPEAAPPFTNPAFPVTCCPGFIDDQTLQFSSRTNFDGGNPEGAYRVFRVQTDGTGLTVASAATAASRGSQVVPVFSITGTGLSALALAVPGTPVNPGLGSGAFPDSISEVFLFDGTDLLQLSNFRRSDTSGGVGVIGETILGDRVFFNASADPFGVNPSDNCQIFSINTLGTDLRELTQFRAAPHSETGCHAGAGAGCYAVDSTFFADRQTNTLVFDSTCDPFGTNPNGQQLFAMRPDGTGLRQLTFLKGVVDAPDGSLDVELPGPIAPAFY